MKRHGAERIAGCFAVVLGLAVLAPPPLVFSETADQGPVLHYTFDDENAKVATDSSGNNLHGTIMGGTLVKQKSGYTLRLNGAGAYVEVPQSPVTDNLGKPGQSYSIALWFKTKGKKDQSLAEKWIGNPYPWAFRGPDTSGLIQFALYDGKDNPTAQIRDGSLTDEQWHYAVGIRGAQDRVIQLYIDGELKSRVTDPVGDVSNSGKLAFGACLRAIEPDIYDPCLFFEGQLDDIGIYNRVLSPQEVKEHFASEAEEKGIAREVKKIRSLHRVVDLSGRTSPLVILMPKDGTYKNVASRLADELRTRLGVTAEITDAPAQALPDAVNTVVMGNVNNNELFARLYWNYYAYADSLFPGDGEFELRTIYDPYPWHGKGDAIAIGCSDVRGAERGVEEFLKRVDAENKSLEYTLVVSSAKPAETVKAGTPTFADFIALAEPYFKTGDRKYAREAIAVLERITTAYEQNPDPEYDHSESEDCGRVMAAWDALEEYPELTDDQRLRFTQSFLRQLRALAAEAKGYGWQEYRENLVTWNHVTFPLRGVYYGARYFWDYYRLTEAKTYLSQAEETFMGQARSWKPEEDADIYVCHTMGQCIEYYLAEWKLDFFANGNAVKFAEYVAGILDSAGYPGGFGDSNYSRSPGINEMQWALPITFWYTRDGRYLWLMQHFMGDSWKNPYHHDVAPVPDTADIGMKIFPLDAQLYEQTKTRSFYNEPLSSPNVPLKAAFDKIAFRESWDKNAQYLLLDGFSRGKHLHYDGNAINVFVDRGKRWLIDHDYLIRNTTEHNMLSVVRNGRVTGLEPSCAGIVVSGQGSAVAMATTEMRDYEGADWQRGVFWKKGKYFVMMEQLSAREAGEFVADVTWKLEDQGAERIVGPGVFRADRPQVPSGVSRNVYVVNDEFASGGKALLFPESDSIWAFTVDLPAGEYGVQLVAYGLDGSSDSLYGATENSPQLMFGLAQARYGLSSTAYGVAAGPGKVRFDKGGKHVLRFWMREMPPIRVDKLIVTDVDGKVVLELEAEDAQAVAAANVASGRADRFWLKWADAVDTRIDRYGTRGISVALCKLWQRRAAQLGKNGAIEIANLFYTDSTEAPRSLEVKRVAAHAVMISGDETALFAVGGISFGELRSDAKMLYLSPERVALAGGGSVRIGDTEIVSRAGDYYEEELTRDARETVAAFLKQVASSSVGPSAQGREEKSVPLAEATWSFDVGAGMKINRLRTADLDGDGREEILIAAGPKALALTADGRLLWEFVIGGLCHDVRAGEATGGHGAEVVVAGGDGFIYLLDSKGKLIRKQEMTDPPRGQESGSARFEVLTAAIFNTDGTPRVFVANSRFDVVTFDMQLNRLARAVYSAEHGGIDLWALDVNGDGKKEVFITDHYGYLNVVAHDGRKIRVYYTSIGDMKAAFGDLNGDGLTEAVFGSSTGDLMGLTFKHVNPWVGDYDNPWWWSNVGYPINQICIADVDGDGKKEVILAVGTGYIHVLDGTGKEKWRHRAQTNVVGVVALKTRDPRLAYIDSAGMLYTIEGQGKQPRVRRLGGKPSILITCENELVVALDDGKVVAVPIQ